jgi:hypothetical protein
VGHREAKSGGDFEVNPETHPDKPTEAGVGMVIHQTASVTSYYSHLSTFKWLRLISPIESN